MPETTYERAAPVTRVRSGEDDDSAAEKGDVLHLENSVPAKHSYFHSLKVYNGLFAPQHSFWRLLVEPLQMIVSPIVLYGGVTYGLYITYLVRSSDPSLTGTHAECHLLINRSSSQLALHRSLLDSVSGAILLFVSPH